MALTFEQWKEIFGAAKLINYSTDSNIFEQIKQELKKQDEDVHKEWKMTNSI